GWLLLAPWTSMARTAYPSIAELVNRGRSIGLSTSSHNGRPSASSSGCSYGCSGPIRSRTFRRCSSTERVGDGEFDSPMATTLAGAERLTVLHGRRHAGIGQRGVADDAHVTAEGPVAFHPQRPRLHQGRGTGREPSVEVVDHLVVGLVQSHQRHRIAVRGQSVVLADGVGVGA